MEEKNYQEISTKRFRPIESQNSTVLETIAAHQPIVILTVQEYNELVAKTEKSDQIQGLLGLLADLGGISDQMKKMIESAIK